MDMPWQIGVGVGVDVGVGVSVGYTVGVGLGGSVGESWQADAATTATEHIRVVHSIVFVFIQAGVRSSGPSSLRV